MFRTSQAGQASTSLLFDRLYVEGFELTAVEPFQPCSAQSVRLGLVL
ncbi:hypothetical protein AB6802_07380 [Mesorhizobium sp. RCC_202]